MFSVQSDMLRFVTSYMFYHSLVKCDVITQRTVPDDVELFPDGSGPVQGPDLHVVKMNKTWLSYIDSNLQHALLTCQGKNKNIFYNLWKCLCHCSPSCKVIKRILDYDCPDKKRLTLELELKKNDRIHIDKTRELKRPVEKSMVGGMSNSAESCKTVLDLWWNLNVFTDRVVVNYRFETNALLRQNVTFVKVDLTRRETVRFINGYECQQILRNKKMITHNCFEFVGRRPKMNVIAQNATLLIKLYIIPHGGKFEAIYQVTDTGTITRQSSVLDVIKLFELHFIWKSKIFVYTTRIMISVFQVLTVKLSHLKGFSIHDGPGIYSRNMKINRPEIILSTFQAFIVCKTLSTTSDLSTNLLTYGKSYLWKSHTDFGLSYFGTNVAAVQVNIFKMTPTILPPCYDLVHNTVNSKAYLCVYNLTSDSGFVNITINKMIFNGPGMDRHIDSSLSNRIPMRCIHGGAAYQVQGHRSHSRFIQMKHLCDNYSSTPSKVESYDKSILNIIGHSRDGHLFAVYFYKHYSQVSLDVTLSTTKCQGVHFYEEVPFGFYTYTTLPETCMVLQFIHKVSSVTISSSIKPLSNHRLFREDKVFLYQSETGAKYSETKHPKLFSKMKQVYWQPILSYYYGTLLTTWKNNPEEHCLFPECYLVKPRKEITDTLHLRVHYPLALNPVYFTTRAVEQPADIDVDTNNFRPFYFGRDRDFDVVGSPYSWITSTIYHINCSSSVDQISTWSGLSTDVVVDICVREPDQQLITKLSTPEQLRIPKHGQYWEKKPKLWNLLFSLQILSNRTSEIPYFGLVTLTTSPAWKLCNKTKMTMIPAWRSVRLTLLKITGKSHSFACAVLQTEAKLYSSLLNKRRKVEVGLLTFDEPIVQFEASEMLLKLSKAASVGLVFEWELQKCQINHMVFNKDRYRLSQYKSTTFSWTMAAVKCREMNMTLPSLKSRKATMEMVQYILQNYALPTYVVFVGLLRKGNQTRWLQQHPLVYYPWEPRIVDSSMSHDLVVEHPLPDFKGTHPNIHMVLSRILYINKVTTEDHSIVPYPDLYWKTEMGISELNAMRTTSDFYGCYALTLVNHIKPYLRPIDCYKPILNSFLCESSKLPILFSDSRKYYELVDNVNVIKCSNQYISKLYICDGHEDCLDGSDEHDCYCFANGVRRNNSIFCSRSCAQYNRCTCAVLYTNEKSAGCQSYIDKQHVKTASDAISMTNSYFCKSSNITIKSHLVDDLVFDCPSQDDEPELVERMFEFRCESPDMTPCYPGHRKCYRNEHKCIYNLTMNIHTLMYCRNGQHLQDCENFECQFMYKCVESYCIPYKYLCDGKWDCFMGDDEMSCKNQNCDSMFKCRSSSTCVHIKNVCDDTADCPLMDDESLCMIQYCIKDCTCLNYGISCKFTDLLEKKWFLMLSNFIYINISESKLKDGFLNELTNAAVFISTHNMMLHPFVCTKNSTVKVQLLDYSFNAIQEVGSSHFSCFDNLLHLNLFENEMNKIGSYVFGTLMSLQALDVSHNIITCLSPFAFNGLQSLKLLDLQGNPLLFIDSDGFSGAQIETIITSNFHVCCLAEASTTVCSSKPSWPSSCNSLLSSKVIKIKTWIIAICVSVFNTVSIGHYSIQWYSGAKPNKYKKFVMAVNTCDLLTGLSLLVLATKDASVGDAYIGLDLSWRSSATCHIVAFISLLSILVSAFLILLMSVSRYNAIKNPLEKAQSTWHTFSPVMYFAISVAIILSTFIYIRNQVEGFKYISSPLCFLLGDAYKSLTLVIVTLSTSLYLLVILVIIVIVYIKLVMELSRKERILNETKQKKRQKAVTTNVILAGFTNSLCYIPSSVFYFVSVFLDEFPIIFVYVITLIILPINAMANPIFFQLSTIKKGWLKLKEIKIKIRS